MVDSKYEHSVQTNISERDEGWLLGCPFLVGVHDHEYALVYRPSNGGAEDFAGEA